jgi:hypothetical protein
MSYRTHGDKAQKANMMATCQTSHCDGWMQNGEVRILWERAHAESVRNSHNQNLYAKFLHRLMCQATINRQDITMWDSKPSDEILS